MLHQVMTSVASRCFVLLDKEPKILEMNNKYIYIYISISQVKGMASTVLA